jgi:hypothetical protein
MINFGKVNRANTKVYDPPGRCIYCAGDGGEQGLTREHVIPDGLEGSIIFRGASCVPCARITSRIETVCLQETYVDYRFVANLKMSKKTKQKTKMKAVTALLLPDLPIPKILSGKPLIVNPDKPSEYIVHGMHCYYFGKDALLPVPPEYVPKTFNLVEFLRLLAKIAHGYAIAELGVNNVDSWLADIILGRAHQDKLQYLIGAADPKINQMRPAPVGLDQESPPRYTLHQLSLLTNATQESIWALSVGIRLFAIHKTPMYQVAVGTLNVTPEIRARFAPGLTDPNP